MEPSIFIEGGLGIAATAAVVEAAKRAGLRSKYAPAMSLVVGWCLALVWHLASSNDWPTTIVLAFLFGGVASHGYDLTKKLRE